jgi:PPOX class probable F420-dependent enzyme
MDETDALLRLARAQVGYLATVGPHIVPFVFAVDGHRIVSMVDAKPKTTTHLQRIQNIRSNPSVSVLVDHYEENWSRLWWVRADGTARVADEDLDHIAALLQAKYPQYADVDLIGPAIIVDIERITGWSAE